MIRQFESKQEECCKMMRKNDYNSVDLTLRVVEGGLPQPKGSIMEKIIYTKAHREIVEHLNIDKWRKARIDVKCPSENTLSKINEVFVSRKTVKTWDDNNIIRASVNPNKKYKVKSSFATCFEVVKIEEDKILATGFVGGTYERDFWIDREDIKSVWLMDKDADNLLTKLENVNIRDSLSPDWVKSGFAKISFERV